MATISSATTTITDGPVTLINRDTGERVDLVREEGALWLRGDWEAMWRSDDVLRSMVHPRCVAGVPPLVDKLEGASFAGTWRVTFVKVAYTSFGRDDARIDARVNLRMVQVMAPPAMAENAEVET